MVSIVAVGFALSALALSNVLPPGFQCHPAPNASKSIDGRTYCYAMVPWPTSGLPVNYTEWGFGFQIWRPTSTFFALPFVVTEPSNGTFRGAIQCTGPCEFGSAGVFACYYQGGLLTSCNPVENESSPAWFTPDNEAGVMFSVVSPMPPSNLTLLVEA